MVKSNSYQLLKSIRAQLLESFPNEAEALAFQLVEHFSGFSRTSILMDKPFTTGPSFETQIKSIINRLIANEPIQYILGKAYFYDRTFIVNTATLIPRQETEELVQLILNDIKEKKNLAILDIGTGTGCIPISLKLENSKHKVEGVDISLKALETANLNAKSLGADVHFFQMDILKQDLASNYDIIISNPPYVMEAEKAKMKANVLEFEPPTALFVPDTNPLLFYKRITELATQYLNLNGRLYFEINEQFGKETVALLTSHSFKQVVLYKDLNGKDRFVSGSWS